MAQVLRGYCVPMLIMSIYFALLPGRLIVPYSTGILPTSTSRGYLLVFTKNCATALYHRCPACICKWYSDNQRCRVKQHLNF
ncbi:uncharacterized protein LACBIDRAFT_313382 [Laccaria bicolor S238N-H82]|uniref:Predicted protein n=1 Tax=Laccaria bicolor (strain S238N-H82 / ATCC MYA-4686) TaxID=486041 RepID=B0DY72_LACBS|nr:uncharacterized protein LACBIDRAFT_313382 [Laccaria bicolor S238N-H82]EDR00470.1 predicted protein [Laccaria bicolor S238N-H82]|eukprot:XP_001888862.1 predicted protein [Laccaria bicolor S238N-H82]